MGQHYLLANLTKSQRMYPGLIPEALAIITSGDSSMKQWLSLLLVDLGYDARKLSLQNLCLKTLCEHQHQYPPALLSNLPQHLQDKMDVMYLSQNLIGEWAGDRLILTGNWSEYCPFPPHGEWRRCETEDNLYHVVESGKFSSSHMARVDRCKSSREIKRRLEKLLAGKSQIVANLDKQEYLDPRTYDGSYPKEVLTGLLIMLTHSSIRRDSDLPDLGSAGVWAGDRVTIMHSRTVRGL